MTTSQQQNGIKCIGHVILGLCQNFAQQWFSGHISFDLRAFLVIFNNLWQFGANVTFLMVKYASILSFTMKFSTYMFTYYSGTRNISFIISFIYLTEQNKPIFINNCNKLLYFIYSLELHSVRLLVF